MFRLTTMPSRKGTKLLIEGELKSEDVKTLESECMAALRINPPVTITLENVTEIDANALDSLKLLVKAGVQVRAVGIYSQHVIRNIKAG